MYMASAHRAPPACSFLVSWHALNECGGSHALVSTASRAPSRVLATPPLALPVRLLLIAASSRRAITAPLPEERREERKLLGVELVRLADRIPTALGGGQLGEEEGTGTPRLELHQDAILLHVARPLAW